MRIAVVGHVEWTEFTRVDRVPAPGEIVHAREGWQQVAGGGAVSAVQIARLAGSCTFLTAFGDDALGHAAQRGLEELGLDVEVAWRARPQRRAVVLLDDAGERTITTIGERLAPLAADDLPWARLADCDAVFFSAGDASALRAARAARRLVVTIRAREALAQAGVAVDALVSSGRDPDELYRAGAIVPEPLAVIRTEGAAGGSIETAAGTTRWAAPPLPAPLVDVHGAGDSFAGGVTVGLAEGLPLAEAVELGSRCGAACATGRGPYERQLRR